MLGFKILPNLFLLVCLLPLVNTQETKSPVLNIGTTHSFDCSATPYTLQFQPLKQFTVQLVSPEPQPLLFDIATLKAPNHTDCHFGNNVTACSFTDMVRDVLVTCSAKTRLQIRIAKGHLLSSLMRVNASSVQIDMLPGERGIVSILLVSDLWQTVKALKHENLFFLKIFSMSRCVKNVALFEDHFKVAVEGEANQSSVCYIAIKQDYTERWSYSRSPLNVSEGEHNIPDYLDANQSHVYNVPRLENMALSLFMESDVQEELDRLLFTITFTDAEGVDEVFEVRNFDAGLELLNALVIYKHQASKVKFHSNIDIFYHWSIKKNQDSTPRINEDQYLFMAFQNETSFILELSDFTEQKSDPYKVKILKSNTSAPSVISFAECFDADSCLQLGPWTPLPTSSEFTPQCTNLTRFDECKIKFKVTNNTGQIMGLLPFVEVSKIKIRPNNLYRGNLEKKDLRHYFLPAEQLKTAADQLTVQVYGARLFLTFDPTCRRVNCADYEVYNNGVSIPNQKTDLYLILEGTIQVAYNFIIDTLESREHSLQNGLMIESELRFDEPGRFFTYEPKSGSDVQITYSALSGSLMLVVNIGGSKFPTKTKSDLKSTDGFLKISKNLFQNNQKLFISLLRIKGNANLDFNIVLSEGGSPLRVPTNKPFTDYFSPKSRKDYLFSLHRFTTDSLIVKLDISQLVQRRGQLVMAVGNEEKYFYNTSESDIATVSVDERMLKKICRDDEDAEPFCTLKVTIYNPLSEGVEAELLVWILGHGLPLTEGQFHNFETGLIDTDTHFYIEVGKPTGPINLYVHSTEVQIEMLSSLFIPKTTVTVDQLPFPHFDKLTEDELTGLVYASSASLRYQKDELIQAFNDSSNGLILITVRDKSNRTKSKTPAQWTKGIVQIVYFSGHIDFREDDKVEIQLLKKESVSVSIDITSYLEDTDQHEIYFHNTILHGLANLQFYVEVNGASVLSPVQVLGQTYILKLQELKEKLNYTKDKGYHYLAYFIINCESNSGRYIASIVSTNSDYTELTLGVPEAFYLRQGEKAVFQFRDYSNQGFRVKINRKNGFPEYKFIVCTKDEDESACIKDAEQVAEQQKNEKHIPAIAAGHSHDLEVHKTSDYCRDCKYYLGLYAPSEDISGNILVTGAGQAAMLIEDTPLTTKVYPEETDIYQFSPPPGLEAELILIPYMGQLSVSIYDSQTNKLVAVLNSNANLEPLNLEIPKRDIFVNYIVKVTASNDQAAMYTIYLNTDAKDIELKDGLAFKLASKADDVNSFRFKIQQDSSLLIRSNGSFKSQILCHNPGDNTSTPINNQPLKSSINHFSQIYSFEAKVCQNYMMVIQSESNQEALLILNTKDVMLLPLAVQIPRKVDQKQSNIYEVHVGESSFLKIVLKLCYRGTIKLGIASSKQSISSGDFDEVYQTDSEQLSQIISYKAKPPLAYLVVYTGSDVPLDYSIEVFKFHNAKASSQQTVTLATEEIKADFLGKNDSKYVYNVTFGEYRITNTTNLYKPEYYILESGSKGIIRSFVRCKGSSYKGEPLVEFKIPGPLTFDPKTGLATVRYFSDAPESFITVVATTSPAIPAYVAQEQYDIIPITAGSGYGAVRKIVDRIQQFVEQNFDIKNQESLIKALVGFIVIVNLLLLLISVVIIRKCCVRVEERLVALPSSAFEANMRSQRDNGVETAEELDLSNNDAV